MTLFCKWGNGSSLEAAEEVKELFLLVGVHSHRFQVAHDTLSLHAVELPANDVDDGIGHLRNEVPVHLVEHEYVPHAAHHFEVEAFGEERDHPLEQVQLGLYLPLLEVEEQLFVIDSKDVLKALLELAHLFDVERVVANQGGRGYDGREYRKRPT